MRQHERLIVAAVVLSLLAGWEALGRFGWLDASLAPAPSIVLAALARLIARPEVLWSLAVTAWEVLAAFFLAVPVGLLLGFVLAEVPILGALFRPLVNFLFGVPKSIFLPVFILVFGVSIPQKIAFGVFTTIFVLVVGGIDAAQSVPRELITVSRVYGASPGQIIREIYVPAMAPILSSRSVSVWCSTSRPCSCARSTALAMASATASLPGARTFRCHSSMPRSSSSRRRRWPSTRRCAWSRGG